MSTQPAIRDLTRRAALGTLAAGGLGFALFGPRTERQASARGRIVLDYWEKWTRHEGEAMQAVVNAFNASQDRIFVRYFVTADIGQKSLVAIAGGDPPDLIGLYAFNVPPYAESGALTPLDDIAPPHGVTIDRYALGVRQVMQHKGQWWATVNTAGSVALYYNRALFREAGLDPDRPPRTIAELDEYHNRLVRKSASGRLERVGFFHPEPGWWSWLWAYHFGGRIYDPAADRSLVASAENIRAMEWMQSYSRSLGVDECKAFRESFGNYFTPENPFLTGKVAMIVQGPWVANLVGAFKPDLDYGVAPFPVAEGLYDPAAPIGLIDTDVLVIPKGARHPEASMEFVAWTQRQDMTELLATKHCKPSPLAQASPEFIVNHPNRGISVHYDIFRSPRAFIPPPTRVWQQFKDEFDTVVQRLWRLEVEPAKALPALETRTQGLLDRARDERLRRHGAAS
ncbi:sn-glycerol-3-phosphate-binding periplasmic protein UgpB [Phycisphaerales bacterium]|nr:sn-glycerol-3-phosphate-binding periplasmic protein UgpB [Phycisphaerales bacterium]